MGLAQLFLAAATATVAMAADLRQVSDFGENPTDVLMYEYVPDKLAEQPAIIVHVSNRGGLMSTPHQTAAPRSTTLFIIGSPRLFKTYRL